MMDLFPNGIFPYAAEGLLFVMGVGAFIAGVTFYLAQRYGRRLAPLTGQRYDLRRKPFDRNVLPGGIVFGIGWGLSGLCPGAAYASLGVGNWPVLIGMAGCSSGRRSTASRALRDRASRSRPLLRSRRAVKTGALRDSL